MKAFGNLQGNTVPVPRIDESHEWNRASTPTSANHNNLVMQTQENTVPVTRNDGNRGRNMSFKPTAAYHADMGDAAFRNQDFRVSVKHYMQALRLILPNPKDLLDEQPVDLIQCKKRCVATSTLLKVSQAFLHENEKEESRKSLQTAETLIRPVVDIKEDKENGDIREIHMLQFSSFTLLSEVMQRTGDLHVLDGNITMAEQNYRKAVSWKRTSLTTMRARESIAAFFPDTREKTLELASQLEKLGGVLQKRGDYRESVMAFGEALTVRQGCQQDCSHSEVLSLLDSLSQAYQDNGEYTSALQCTDDLVRYYNREEGASQLLLKAIIRTSQLYILNNDCTLAMNTATDALDMANSHGLGADAAEQMAKVLEAQTNLDEAMLWHERAYSLRSSFLAPSHDLVTKSAKEMARLACKQGEYDKAKTLFKEIRDAMVKEYGGVEHPSVASLLDDLGCVYSEQEAFTMAMKCHMKALAIRKRCQNNGRHSDAAVTMDKIAIIHLKAGRRSEAMEFFGEALSVLRNNHFCQSHPLVQSTIRDMS